MIVGLQAGAEYMTRKGRPTTVRGLQSLLTSGRHPEIGWKLGGRGNPWSFTEADLDRLMERVRPWHRRVG